MQFKDLLDILNNNEQLKVVVINDYGEREYYRSVKEFKEFVEVLVLKVHKIFTRVIEGGYISVILNERGF